MTTRIDGTRLGITVEHGRSAMEYLEELCVTLREAEPDRWETVAWAWVAAAIECAMDPEVAEAFRVLALGIFKHGLP
jgi:hypothetical protein